MIWKIAMIKNNGSGFLGQMYSNLAVQDSICISVGEIYWTPIIIMIIIIT